MAAVLGGEVAIKGDPRLLVRLQRLFPRPPRRSNAAAGRRLRGKRRMSDGLVQILDGNTFVVSDACGDIEASPTDPTGLFPFDTRFLSRWVLTVNGERLNALSVDDACFFSPT
jgi:N-terminal domain of (some) glycogen debranching enzymes